MRRAPRIAIVGGGVGGLAAALALERRGAEIIVCEQSPALNEIGAGLNLSPNALMALRVLGVEDAVVALGSESDFLIIRSWKSGRIISRMRRGAFRQQFGAPNVTVHRADLLDVLRGALKTADIRLGARCIAIEARDRSAVARLADGSEIETDKAPTAFILLSERACSALTRRDSPAVSAGVAWRRLARCRATWPSRKAPCGWARTVMSCTIPYDAANSSTSSLISTAILGKWSRGRGNATYRS
jgi:salicylate hydroxylase